MTKSRDEKARRAGLRSPYRVVASVGDTGRKMRVVELGGRFAEALLVLVRRRSKGVTPMDFSRSGAARLSHYVHVLRRDHGFDVETVWEPHATAIGSTGRHGRYILRDTVRILRVTRRSHR